MSAFFVDRPIVAMVISIVMVLLGTVAMSGLPIAQYPEIVPPMVQVSTSFTGASATDVEASVATPLEQKMNGVENMIYMKSTNANDGSFTLKVSFEVGTDLDKANVLTQTGPLVSNFLMSLDRSRIVLFDGVTKPLSSYGVALGRMTPGNGVSTGSLTNANGVSLPSIETVLREVIGSAGRD
jgi:HAE1 family hydrophobic/amphiphilic exporter-1